MKKTISFLLLSFFLFPGLSHAAMMEADEKVYVDQPVDDDAYLAGQEVRVNAEVRGDLYMAGGNVILYEPIQGDGFLAGSMVDIKGEIKDDLKAVGNTVTLDSKVGGDAMLGGENIVIQETSGIGGDLLVGGTTIRIDAPVGGWIRGAGQDFYLNSEVKGNVYLYGVQDLTFGPQAKILGNLTYSAQEAATISESVVTGKINFKKEEIPQQKDWSEIFAKFSLFSLLSTLLFGLLFLALARHFLFYNTQKALQSPFKSMGIGFLVLITFPLSALMFMVTVVGIPMGIILMILWGVALYLSKIMAAAFVGGVIIKLKEDSTLLRAFGSFALGAVIYTILDFIPFIGWALKFLLILIALGSFFMAQQDRFKALKTKKLV